MITIYIICMISVYSLPHYIYLPAISKRLHFASYDISAEYHLLSLKPIWLLGYAHFMDLLCIVLATAYRRKPCTATSRSHYRPSGSTFSASKFFKRLIYKISHTAHFIDWYFHRHTHISAIYLPRLLSLSRKMPFRHDRWPITSKALT